MSASGSGSPQVRQSFAASPLDDSANFKHFSCMRCLHGPAIAIEMRSMSSLVSEREKKDWPQIAQRAISGRFLISAATMRPAVWTLVRACAGTKLQPPRSITSADGVGLSRRFRYSSTPTNDSIAACRYTRTPARKAALLWHVRTNKKYESSRWESTTCLWISRGRTWWSPPGPFGTSSVQSTTLRERPRKLCSSSQNTLVGKSTVYCA